MKRCTKFLCFLSFVFFFSFILMACNPDQTTNYSYLKITTDKNITLQVEDTFQIEYEISDNLKKEQPTYSISGSGVTVSTDGLVTAIAEGSCSVTVKIKNIQDSLTFTIKSKSEPVEEEVIDLTITSSTTKLFIGENLTLSGTYTNSNNETKATPNDIFKFLSGSSYATLTDNVLVGTEVGTIEVIAEYGGLLSNAITITISSKPVYLSVEISADKLEAEVDDIVTLSGTYTTLSGSTNLPLNSFAFSSNTTIATIENNLLTCISEGTVDVVASYNGIFSNVLTITITKKVVPVYLEINVEKTDLKINESTTINATLSNNEQINNDDIEIQYTSGANLISINNLTITGLSQGTAVINIKYHDFISNTITITVLNQKVDKLILDYSPFLNLPIGEILTLSCHFESGRTFSPENALYEIVSGRDIVYLDGNEVMGYETGTFEVTAFYAGFTSQPVKFTITDSLTNPEFTLRSSKYYITQYETTQLLLSNKYDYLEDWVEYVVVTGKNYLSVSETGLVSVLATGGSGTIKVKYSSYSSNEITISTVPMGSTPSSILLSISNKNINAGDYADIDFTVSPATAASNVKFVVTEGNKSCEIVHNKIYVYEEVQISFYAQVNDVKSNVIVINQTGVITSDPYVNVTESQFYTNYTKATSYLDSYYRTKHNFMSGAIEAQDQEPTIATNRPTLNNLYVRNTSSLYSADKNTYYVVNSHGQIVNEIYRGGAYVTLEEVAAYIMAFGNVPANYSDNKYTSPSSSVWGKYLRVNNTEYSGDTKSFPYEPVMPNIRGCGGSFYYYETDIGTTGTDCDPSFPVKIYNDGTTITRGAARIIYTRYDENKQEFTDNSKKYIFYTYNHYNDFQEYLNYENGWGKMFGNITGGGTISSKYDYNPTPYVNVSLSNLNDSSTKGLAHYLYLPRRKKFAIFA